MSIIRTEIHYPRNEYPYIINALHGEIDISRISDDRERGKELYLIEVDGIRKQKHKGRKLRIKIRRDLMEEIVSKIVELFEVTPDSKFSTFDGKTYYSHDVKTKSIEF